MVGIGEEAERNDRREKQMRRKRLWTRSSQKLRLMDDRKNRSNYAGNSVLISD